MWWMIRYNIYCIYWKNYQHSYLKKRLRHMCSVTRDGGKGLNPKWSNVCRHSRNTKTNTREIQRQAQIPSRSSDMAHSKKWIDWFVIVCHGNWRHAYPNSSYMVTAKWLCENWKQTCTLYSFDMVKHQGYDMVKHQWYGMVGHTWYALVLVTGIVRHW